MYGSLAAVSVVPQGAPLAIDATAGATSIALGDVVDFSATGGTAAVQAADGTWSSFTYSSTDPDTATMTVAGAGLPIAAPTGTTVAVWPLQLERRGAVIVDDGDMINAAIPIYLALYLPSGQRQATDAGADGMERVRIVDDGGTWTIVDVLPKAPTLTLPPDAARIYAQKPDAVNGQGFLELLGSTATLSSGSKTGLHPAFLTVTDTSFMLDAQSGTSGVAHSSISGDENGLHFNLSTPYAVNHPKPTFGGRLAEWVNLTPTNSWSAPTTIQARMLLTGEVAIRGRITHATSSKTGVFATLPAYFYPAAAETYVLNSGTGAARVQIGTDGAMSVLGYMTGASATSGVNLNGIRVLTS